MDAKKANSSLDVARTLLVICTPTNKNTPRPKRTIEIMDPVCSLQLLRAAAAASLVHATVVHSYGAAATAEAAVAVEQAKFRWDLNKALQC